VRYAVSIRREESISLGLEVVGRDGVVDPPKESDPNIGVVNLSVE
jgi:hypothetical protein